MKQASDIALINERFIEMNIHKLIDDSLLKFIEIAVKDGKDT